MLLLLHIQVKCWELLLEHCQGFDQFKNQCLIHEVEVDTIKKDNLSLYHYMQCLYCCVILEQL